MKIYISTSVNPYFNLALEEYLVKHTDINIFLFYINTSSVIIGKHQIPFKEVCPTYFVDDKFELLRRISGGGAVYHDIGNINFSIIKTTEPGKQVNFKKYAGYIADYLSSIGLKPYFDKRNNLFIDGKKISGNAEFVYKNRVLHHGTILYNTNLEILKNILKNNNAKSYKSKAVLSVPSDVTNISNYINTNKDSKAFLLDICNYITDKHNTSEAKGFYEIDEVYKLAEQRQSLSWVCGYSPDYVLDNDLCEISVSNGRIKKIKKLVTLFDFDINILFGKFHHPKVIAKALYDKNISNKEIDNIINIIF
ncbi:MAG: lipoate--protein ligase [Marinilabiliales bacterium]